MKHMAMLYAVGQWVPRLSAVRARTWIVLALASVTAMGLRAWAAVARLSWAWHQAGDVSGADPKGLERYAGLVRTYYANDAGRLEVRYTGSGALQAVLQHYLSQLENAGYRHDVLLATPSTERHRFSKHGSVRELALRRTGAADGLEVTIVEQTH